MNIGGKEAAALSTFHISVPLPEVSGGITGPGRGAHWPSHEGQAPGFHLLLDGTVGWLFTRDWVLWWPALAGGVSPG